MGFRNMNFTCKQVNEFDIVDYLAALGIHPAKIRDQNYWYLSPLRVEKTPSFKVNRHLNRWYDFAMGKGGTLIDFATDYHRCTIGEFLQTMATDRSLLRPGIPAPKKEFVRDPASKILVTRVRSLVHPALIGYLNTRRIPLCIARQYCKQVHFQLYGKDYFAIGFKNDLGGYELRNVAFKGSSSPKTITHVKAGAPVLSVFEGFFNFLSFLTLFTADHRALTDFLILNSLAFFEVARQIMEAYAQVDLYLDNGTAGTNTTLYARGLSPVYHDGSGFYKHHEDLNEYLCQFGLKKTDPPPR